MYLIHTLFQELDLLQSSWLVFHYIYRIFLITTVDLMDIDFVTWIGMSWLRLSPILVCYLNCSLLYFDIPQSYMLLSSFQRNLLHLIIRVEDGGGRFIENIGNYLLSFILKMEATASSSMLVIAYQAAQYPSEDHSQNSHYYKILVCFGMLTVLNLRFIYK